MYSPTNKNQKKNNRKILETWNRRKKKRKKRRREKKKGWKKFKKILVRSDKWSFTTSPPSLKHSLCTQPWKTYCASWYEVFGYNMTTQLEYLEKIFKNTCKKKPKMNLPAVIPANNAPLCLVPKFNTNVWNAGRSSHQKHKEDGSTLWTDRMYHPNSVNNFKLKNHSTTQK